MPTVIENPILNSPFRDPARHFRFDEDGITSEIVDERRRSTCFIPIPKPKKKVAAPAEQMTLPGNWTSERMQENDNINRIRAHVAGWRQAGWPGITATTRELLDYWTTEDRDRPLFFCQIEALETAIFITEVAGKEQQWIDNLLREEAADIDPDAWESLSSATSRSFPQPESGKIAVKVINHYGDEILKVYDLTAAVDVSSVKLPGCT